MIDPNYIAKVEAKQTAMSDAIRQGHRGEYERLKRELDEMTFPYFGAIARATNDISGMWSHMDQEVVSVMNGERHCSCGEMAAHIEFQPELLEQMPDEVNMQVVFRISRRIRFLCSEHAPADSDVVIILT